jgi:hypothetical protein
MFTLKIKRDSEGEGDPGSELWIAGVSLVSNLGRRTRRDVMNGCWAAYEARDYGQSIHTPVMRPVAELAVGACIWLDGDITLADGRPAPTGVWTIRKWSHVGTDVPITMQIVNADETCGQTIQLPADKLVSTSPLVPNDEVLLTLLYVEQEGMPVHNPGWWCIAQTAWLLGPDGQTIERIAP